MSLSNATHPTSHHMKQATYAQWHWIFNYVILTRTSFIKYKQTVLTAEQKPLRCDVMQLVVVSYQSSAWSTAYTFKSSSGSQASMQAEFSTHLQYCTAHIQNTEPFILVAMRIQAPNFLPGSTKQNFCCLWLNRHDVVQDSRVSVRVRQRQHALHK